MTPLQLLFLVFGTVFVAEMGDKTQLLLVAMAGKYKIRHILAGTWAATLVLNVLAVAVGAALSQYLDMRVIKSIAALAFFYFAWSGLKGEDDGGEETVKQSKLGPVAAIFVTFFLGELGDKTQLSAITLAAAYSEQQLMNAVMICAGCTLGLIAADGLGLLAGLLLKNNIPTKFLDLLTFAVFTLFGVLNAKEALALIFPQNAAAMWAILAGLVIVFALACFGTARKNRKV